MPLLAPLRRSARCAQSLRTEPVTPSRLVNRGRVWWRRGLANRSVSGRQIRRDRVQGRLTVGADGLSRWSAARRVSPRRRLQQETRVPRPPSRPRRSRRRRTAWPSIRRRALVEHKWVGCIRPQQAPPWRKYREPWGCPRK